MVSENKRFNYVLGDGFTDYMMQLTATEVCDLLNEQEETIQSLTKDKKYFLKVIFAMGNYAEKGDYERIIDARDKVKQRVMHD